MFTTLPQALIEIGKAIKKELWQTTKDNMDDLDSRVSDVEGASSSTLPLDFFVVGEGTVLDDAARLRCPFNITITGVRLRVAEAGTSGTTEVDVLVDLGAGFVTVLGGGNLQLAFGAGDDAEVITPSLAVTDVDAGDTFRLDIKAKQSRARNYQIEIIYTVRS